MKCTKCGIKIKKSRNIKEWLFMMTKGKNVIRGAGRRTISHYCSRCRK